MACFLANGNSKDSMKDCRYGTVQWYEKYKKNKKSIDFDSECVFREKEIGFLPHSIQLLLAGGNCLFLWRVLSESEATPILTMLLFALAHVRRRGNEGNKEVLLGIIKVGRIRSIWKLRSFGHG